jgi:hypothetical protein
MNVSCRTREITAVDVDHGDRRDQRRRLQLQHGFAGQRRQRAVDRLRQPDAAEDRPAAHAIGARGFQLAARHAGLKAPRITSPS